MQPLDQTLRRSYELDAAACALLRVDDFPIYDGSARHLASFHACCLAVEHARAIRSLISARFGATAIATLRIQLEAQVRGMWLLYAASDLAVEKLDAELGPESEKAAGKLSMLSDMLKEMRGKAPPSAMQSLEHFKAVLLPAVHSYVHAGIHAIHRTREGCPDGLLDQTLRISNAIFTMSAASLAILTGDPAITTPVFRMQPAFADCLPELLPTANPPDTSR